MKVAVITPYCSEADDTLWRCHTSVLQQRYPANHIFVSDGTPSREIDRMDAQHIILSRCHNDGGNTPRGIGAMSALSQGFEAICFLDADNWFDEFHVQRCVETCTSQNVDVAFSGRHLVLPSGQVCNFDDLEDAEGRHVDTSCYFITDRAAHVASMWGKIPHQYWQICDRIMLAAIRSLGVSHAWTGHKTVYYSSLWGMHFRAMGVPVPDNEHLINWSELSEIFDPSLLERRLGFDPQLDRSIFASSSRADASDPSDFQSRVRFLGS